MCKFCENVIDKGYDMKWNMRASISDDNFCEKVLEDRCENCKKCDTIYKLNGGYIDDSDQVYLRCEYKFDNGDIIMHNFTEPLPINFCPYCGKQLVENIINFDDIGSHKAEIVDENNKSLNYDLNNLLIP